MKKLTISFVLFIVPLITMAQTNVSGNVVDAESNEPLVGASIIIKDDNGKIIKFTTTKGSLLSASTTFPLTLV